ncbi:MAG: formate/nitrite transporter family protein [Candidatus Portnoybacteria bacterium]|nr:formate/nitrite transporter family protein [Candidatus Portnoybacteria bacterium]
MAKAVMGWKNLFVLGVLAGAFIGLGAMFATAASAGLASSGVAYGVIRLVLGGAFCLGLILVVNAGSELFTGNNLIVMALASKRITTAQLLRNWFIVYMGNFVGSVLTAYGIFLTAQFMDASGIIGANALAIANFKCNLAFIPALTRGIFCNALVCLAVWLCFAGRSEIDKIAGILWPITCFVAAGFEHCIANMYFMPVALFIKDWAPATFWTAIGKTAADYGALTWTNFLWANLLPATIGNIIGGAALVGLVYWFIYKREPKGGSPFVK